MQDIPQVIPNQEWGIDISYLTPSYLANFRPAYKDRLKNKAEGVRNNGYKTARRR